MTHIQMSTWIKRQCAVNEKRTENGQTGIHTIYTYEHFCSLCRTFKALSHLFTENIIFFWIHV